MEAEEEGWDPKVPTEVLDVEGHRMHAKTLTELEQLDDDGHIKRTGNYIKTSAHIITAVIGSGVLSLAWSMATMGWLGGVASLVIFPAVTLYCSNMLIDCYRYPTNEGPRRNYKYIDAVGAYLPAWQVYFCGFWQYLNLIATSIGYSITAGISLAAIDRLTCLHQKGEDAPCPVSATMMIMIFNIVQVFLCQIPDMDRVWIISVVAAIMSYFYASVVFILSVVYAFSPHSDNGSIVGSPITDSYTGSQKMYGIFQGLGNIAFAYSFSNILIEIEDTVGGAPREHVTMKKATLVSVLVTTFYYMGIAMAGYAAFGNSVPGNMLAGPSFAFKHPLWLINMANAAVFVHILGAWQVWTLPWFQFFEGWVYGIVPDKGIGRWVHWEKKFRIPFTDSVYHFSAFRLVWRTAYVVATTVISMLMPFFNDVLGFVGAIGFWPLTVYFPIAMHKVQHNVQRYSKYWWWLMFIDVTCLIVSILAAIGSVEGIVVDSQGFQPFVFNYK